MSQLLNTQLDKETLATCVGMIESGVNPEALAVSANPFYTYLELMAVEDRLLSKSLGGRARL